MRVSFDEQIFLMQRHGGVSRYFVELIRQLQRLPGVDPVLPKGPVATPRAADALGLRLSRSATGRRLQLARRRLRPPSPRSDLVHHTFYDPAFLRRTGAPRRVITVYDMVPEVLPDLVPAGVHHAKRLYVTEADLILAISQQTRNDLIDFYGTPDAPIVVTPLGVDDLFFKTAPPVGGLPTDYLLFVGNRSGYKDFEVLLRALTAVPGPSLVAVGGGAWTEPEHSLLVRLGLAGRVVRRDLTDTELVGAYAHARAFVLPSRYEGFGLPILEAMAAGTIVIAADAGSLPEVGGPAARYFPVGDAGALSTAILDLLSDDEGRERLVRAGRERAREFSWRRTAERTLAAYQTISAPGPTEP